MKNSVLVLGASIAGMRSAAELAQQGFKVYLVEKESQIGGHVAEIDRLFPDEECAACAIQPLILELLDNPNSTILTSAQLLTLDGQAGDFQVTVSQGQTADKGSQRKQELRVGAVIVAPGVEDKNGEMPEEFKNESRALAEKLELELDEDGRFMSDPKTGHPLLTTRKGIFICGATQGSRGIGESIIQACAAAIQVASFLTSIEREESDESEEQKTLIIETHEEPKIAVIFDQGEGDIKDLLDFDELIQYVQSLPGVLQAEMAPNASDGTKIQELLSSGSYNRLIIAGPSPIPHEGLFQRHAAKAGLNPYLLEMVNLHNQCAQVHSGDKTQATEKAKTLLRMGIARAEGLEPLEGLNVDISQNCLVVGASPSGVACAIRLAEMGICAHLVDHSNELGKIRDSNHPLLSQLNEKLSNSKNIAVHSPTRVKEIKGYLGNFTAGLEEQGKSEDIEAGAIVIASPMSTKESEEPAQPEEALALERGPDGFYQSTQGILNLLDFSIEGAFNCGAARASLEIQDAILDGEAAASRAACLLMAPSITRSPVISCVVNENCDGCAYCIDPCPTRSLTLLEYKHKDSVKKVAEVNEVTCIGCGICMSTCPKKGIFVKHYKLESFSDMVKAAHKESDFEPSIISFCCNRCAYPGADNAGSLDLQYPPNVKIIRSVCSGMIHPNIIIDALTQEGADGVLLCGCHVGNCRSRNGILKAEARAEAIDLMLEDLALEPERFRLEHIAASEGQKFAKVITEMTEELSALGPNPYK
jgi:heterodisulfide reductase subunit A-like polyferredoxin/coenzyme F420-reducing hydrogenase delta subunit